VWDLAQNRMQWHAKLSTGRVCAAAFAGDGSRVAVYDEKETVAVLDVCKAKEIITVAEGVDGVTCIAASLDGTVWATGGWKAVRATSCGSNERKQIDVPARHTTCVSVSLDGRLLATGSFEGTVRVWDIPTGRRRSQLRAHKGAVSSASFAPDGKTLATGGVEGVARLWDLASSRIVREFHGHQGSVAEVFFAPDGRLLATATLQAICLWDTSDGHALFANDGHQCTIKSISFSDDGEMLLSADGQTACLWEAATGRLAHRFGDRRDPVAFMAYAKDGRIVLWKRYKGEALVLDAASKEVRRRIELRDPWIERLVFSPGLEFAVSWGSGIRPISSLTYLWSASGGWDRRLLGVRQTGVARGGFSADGRFLALSRGGFEEGLDLWEINGSEARHRSCLDRGLKRLPRITWVAFPSDSRVLAAGNEEGTVLLWETATGEFLQSLRTPYRGKSSACFSRDGRTLALGCENGDVRLIEVCTGLERGRFRGHIGSVETVAFSMDGKRVASGSTDTTVCIWDVTGRVGARNQWREAKVPVGVLDLWVLV
jgi:WD40 repeat protein